MEGETNLNKAPNSHSLFAAYNKYQYLIIYNIRVKFTLNLTHLTHATKQKNTKPEILKKALVYGFNSGLLF